VLVCVGLGADLLFFGGFLFGCFIGKWGTRYNRQNQTFAHCVEFQAVQRIYLDIRKMVMSPPLSMPIPLFFFFREASNLISANVEVSGFTRRKGRGIYPRTDKGGKHNSEVRENPTFPWFWQSGVTKMAKISSYP
jgi:hypothetical protein